MKDFLFVVFIDSVLLFFNMARFCVQTLDISSGSPWKNGYKESFHDGKFRDELLNGETFYTLKEAPVLIERWRPEYNTVRPRSSLDHHPSAPEAWIH